jgi:transposase
MDTTIAGPARVTGDGSATRRVTNDASAGEKSIAGGRSSAVVLETLEAHIAFLDEQINQLMARIHDHIDQHPDLKQQKDLLTSIPGIADVTAARLLAEIPSLDRFEEASQLAAYAGLTPREHQSGSSVFRRGHLSKTGNAHLRRALYMPALVALRDTWPHERVS